MKSGLTSRDSLRARPQNDVKMRQTSTCAGASSRSRRRRQRIKQEEANLQSAQYDLSKVRIVSPIDGIVTQAQHRRGRDRVVGTMNNAGTVLLTDRRHVGHRGRNRGRRDRHPVRHDRPAGEGHDRRAAGQDVSAARSPKSATARSRRPPASTTRATNFKVIVTIDGQVPNVRPGFTCTAVDHDGDAPEGDRACRFRR